MSAVMTGIVLGMGVHLMELLKLSYGRPSDCTTLLITQTLERRCSSLVECPSKFQETWSSLDVSLPSTSEIPTCAEWGV